MRAVASPLNKLQRSSLRSKSRCVLTQRESPHALRLATQERTDTADRARCAKSDDVFARTKWSTVSKKRAASSTASSPAPHNKSPAASPSADGIVIWGGVDP